MRVGLQEGDIKAGLASGGFIRDVLITSEVLDGEPLYRVYIRSSWSPYFLPLRSWADRSDRVYRDLNRLVRFVREDCAYRHHIVIYCADDPRLGRYRVLAFRKQAGEIVKQPLD